MLRFILALILIGLPGAHMTTTPPSNREFRDMPVVVFYCNEDPGRIEAGGGKDPAPEVLLQEGLCTPAEGVSVTFLLVNDDWDFEEDEPASEIDWEVDEDSWFARCDIHADGHCALNSPTGFDIVLGAVLHEGTVIPGYTPAFFPATTHNFTEFAGWGLALIPEDTEIDPAAEAADHQTLALRISHNDEPALVLTEWEINGEDNDVYLATTEGGWVSSIVAANDEVKIDLVNIGDDDDVSLTCVANEDAAAQVDASVDDDGDLKIVIPDTESDIRCDVIITS
jgi:hypothetical protein